MSKILILAMITLASLESHVLIIWHLLMVIHVVVVLQVWLVMDSNAMVSLQINPYLTKPFSVTWFTGVPPLCELDNILADMSK